MERQADKLWPTDSLSPLQNEQQAQLATFRTLEEQHSSTCTRYKGTSTSWTTTRVSKLLLRYLTSSSYYLEAHTMLQCTACLEPFAIECSVYCVAIGDCIPSISKFCCGTTLRIASWYCKQEVSWLFWFLQQLFVKWCFSFTPVVLLRHAKYWMQFFYLQQAIALSTDDKEFGDIRGIFDTKKL